MGEQVSLARCAERRTSDFQLGLGSVEAQTERVPDRKREGRELRKGGGLAA